MIIDNDIIAVGWNSRTHPMPCQPRRRFPLSARGCRGIAVRTRDQPRPPRRNASMNEQKKGQNSKKRASKAAEPTLRSGHKAREPRRPTSCAAWITASSTPSTVRRTRSAKPSWPTGCPSTTSACTRGSVAGRCAFVWRSTSSIAPRKHAAWGWGEGASARRAAHGWWENAHTHSPSRTTAPGCAQRRPRRAQAASPS